MAKAEIALKDKLLVSTDEAAAILTTSAPTLTAIVKVGLIRRLQIKGKNKFYIEELHDFCRRMMDKNIDPSAPPDEIIRNLV